MSHTRDVFRRLAMLGLALCALIAGGTIAYSLLEHANAWNAFIWTVDTVATTGAIQAPHDTAGEIIKVLLTFFVPAIVYMAGAVGAQTVTVIVRGLSTGVPVRAVVWRELITGLVIGAIVGAVFLPFALIVWGEVDVAVAIGLALAASCGTATVTAMALPWMFQKLGTDPAFGSGPLATVIQDLLSLVIYFAIAIPVAT